MMGEKGQMRSRTGQRSVLCTRRSTVYVCSVSLLVGRTPMTEHGFNRVDESPTRSRGHFLELVGFGLLAVAGGVGGCLLACVIREVCHGRRARFVRRV